MNDPDAGATGTPSGVLYQRHRPSRFDDLVGQDAAAALLRNAVAGNNTPHAWLFSGPRGTGKTSSARILAAALGCEDRAADGEPCNRCSHCVAVRRGNSLDVVELDAASHSGVDSIRELCNSAQLSAVGRHRVFILDEVHMLSNAASNALLKTLEEPPRNVTFVLATTETRKVPETVRSRCVSVPFRLVAADVMAAHLRRIVDADGLDASDTLIAEAVTAGAGSVRDTLSALEALLAGGSAARLDVSDLLDAVSAVDLAAVLSGVDALCATGVDPREILEALAVACRREFLAIMGGTTKGTPAPVVATMEGLGEAMARASAGWDARVALELSLVGRLGALTAQRAARA